MEGSDPYEKQLLAVFESCEGGTHGALSRSGLQELFQKLELEEQSNEITKWLLSDPTKDKITFQEFQGCLVKFLGHTQGEDLPPRGGASPAREVSPKYVFGKKKYGRRTRPENSDEESCASEEALSSASTDTEETIPKKRKTHLEEAQQSELPTGSPVKSPSGNEEEVLEAAWAAVCHESQQQCLTRSELVKVFQLVGLDDGSDEAAQRVFEKLRVDPECRITLQELLEFIRSGGDVTQVQEARGEVVKTPSLDFVDSSPVGCVSGGVLVEQWGQYGVPGATQLLNNLGHSVSQTVDLPSLANVLFEELKVMSEECKLLTDPYVALLRANLVLHQVYIQSLRSSMEHMMAEKDKLKNDVVEANHRALLLAQEVDDNHSKLELSTQQQIRELEQRHSEKLRTVTEQVKRDQEQLSVQNAMLEHKVHELEAEEAKCKAMLAQLELENKSLELEHQTVLDQLARCQQVKEKLEQDLESLSGLQQKLAELEGTLKQNEMLCFMDRISDLERENRELKDKNDELAIEVEDLTTQLHTLAIKKRGDPQLRTTQRGKEELEDSVLGGATKRRGEASAGEVSTEDSGEETDSPRLGKVRRCEDFETRIQGLQLDSLSHGESIEDDLETAGLDQRHEVLKSSEEVPFALELEQVLKLTNKHTALRQLEETLSKLKGVVDGHVVKEIQDLLKCITVDHKEEELEVRCRELEASLQLMKEECDKTEDYWAEKLEEEKGLFEEEQRQSDEKYGELLQKIIEYEELLQAEREQRQGLDTIDERVSLEKQVTDMEEEYLELRTSLEGEMRKKEEELDKLKDLLTQKQSKADATCQVGNNGFEVEEPTKRCKGSKRSLTFTSGDRKLRFCPCCRNRQGNATTLSGEVKALQDSKTRLRMEVDVLLGERGALYKEVLDKRRELSSYMVSLASAGGSQSLKSRLQYWEQRCHSLTAALRQQQQHTEEVLNSSWKQHKAETKELKRELKSAGEKVRSQSCVIQEQLTQLARTDVLVKDLFVENAHLISTVRGLEQQCHALKAGEFTV